MEMSQPKSLRAEPARRAEPRAVDLGEGDKSAKESNERAGMRRRGRDSLPHLRSLDDEASKIRVDLGEVIRVGDSSVNAKLLELGARVRTHGFEDGSSLVREVKQREPQESQQ